MADNLRHAQYDATGTGVDDPQTTKFPVVASAGGILYANGALVPVAQILLNSAPNLTLNDTSGGAGTTATPFGISCTIPGGVMGAASAIRVYSAIDWVGANIKSTIMRIGQASGSWSTATAVSGQSGLSNHRYTPLGAIIGNDGLLTQQRSTSANAVNWFNSSTAAVAVVTNIDTALDWNIYIGVQFGVLNGGDTATLRRVIVELLP